MVYGSSSSTPCSRANLTNSACLRSENTGSCHLPVTGCLVDLNGFGPLQIFPISDGCMPATDVLCSRGEVCEAAVNGDSGLVGEREGCKRAGGGYRANNLASLGGRVFANRIYCDVEAIINSMTYLRSAAMGK